jgi:hypothetical protein
METVVTGYDCLSGAFKKMTENLSKIWDDMIVYITDNSEELPPGASRQIVDQS